MTDYKPGTVAVATVRGVPDVRVMWLTHTGWIASPPHRGEFIHLQSEVTDVRPLVVLDLHPRTLEQVLGALRDSEDSDCCAVACEIEEQTWVTHDEPTELGALVKDTRKRIWARMANGAWQCLNEVHLRRSYDEIAVVEVIRP